MIRHHRRTAYHGWTYWITWAVVFVAVAAGAAALYLTDYIAATLGLALLLVLCVGVTAVVVADVAARLVERSGSPREQARSLYAANVQLVRALEQTERALVDTAATLSTEQERNEALRRDLDRAVRDWRYEQNQARHWRHRFEVATNIQPSGPPVPADVTAVLAATFADPNATMVYPAVPAPADSAETAVLPPVGREVSR